MSAKKRAGKKLTVCIAIPTYNREDVLIDTLNSVMALRPAPDEVLVVDQTAEHEKATLKKLNALKAKKKIRYIFQQKPSLTLARNRAIQETKSDVVIFIDDDVELPKDFVTSHLKNYTREDIKAVAGGVRQTNKPQYPSLPAGGKWPRVLDYKFFSVYDQKRTEGVATFMGCNHSARTSLLRQLQGYDTNYVGSAFREDTDMAVRIWKSGGVIIYDPKARLHHLAAPTGGCRINTPVKINPEWYVAFNRHYFAFRHLFPSLEFWKMFLFVDLRQTVLRKANVFKPWKLPWAFFSYLSSAVRALAATLKKQRLESQWRRRSSKA